MGALSNLVQVVPTVAPTLLNHYDLQRAVTITGSLAPGATLGEVLPQIDAIAREQLPPGFSTALGDVSHEFVESSAEVYFTFVVALVFIYLVLSAQFESFVHPITILVSVPLACSVPCSPCSCRETRSIYLARSGSCCWSAW